MTSKFHDTKYKSPLDAFKGIYGEYAETFLQEVRENYKVKDEVKLPYEVLQKRRL